jgi:hypothetical protein
MIPYWLFFNTWRMMRGELALYSYSSTPNLGIKTF